MHGIVQYCRAVHYGAFVRKLRSSWFRLIHVGSVHQTALLFGIFLCHWVGLYPVWFQNAHFLEAENTVAKCWSGSSPFLGNLSSKYVMWNSTITPHLFWSLDSSFIMYSITSHWTDATLWLKHDIKHAILKISGLMENSNEIFLLGIANSEYKLWGVLFVHLLHIIILYSKICHDKIHIQAKREAVNC